MGSGLSASPSPGMMGWTTPATASRCASVVVLSATQERGRPPWRLDFDLAKSVFQVHAVDAAGLVVLQRRLRRSAVKAFFAQLPPCLVAMEACGSAHYWARELSGLGH